VVPEKEGLKRPLVEDRLAVEFQSSVIVWFKLWEYICEIL